MTQVDFLPESYRRNQQRRGRRLRYAGVVLSVLGCLIVATVVTKAHTRNAQLYAERLESTVESEQVTLGALDNIAKEHDTLVKRARLRRELEPAVMYSQVIAALTKFLPADIAVSELTMQTVKPAPEQKETDAQREARLRRSKKDKDTKPAYEPHLIGVELKGLASDDLAVANLVSELDDHPLFSQVKMRSSRATQTHGVQAQEFSLTVAVDLDRELVWTETVAEVSDAD